MNSLSFLPVCVSRWMNRRQQAVIEYLQEEVRVLPEQLGKGPRCTDDQRRGLGVETHWDVIAATGFFTAEVWTPAGLVSCHVLARSSFSFRSTLSSGKEPPEAREQNHPP